MALLRRAVPHWRSVCLACVVFSLAGCSGGKTGKVSGTVTFDGKPLKRGRINFVNEKGKTATAEIEEGEFSLKNAPLGDEVKATVVTGHLAQAAQQVQQLERELKVTEDAIAKLPNKSDIPETMQQELDTKREQVKRLREEATAFVKIPDSYTKPETTPLKFKLKSGDKIEVEVEVKK